jgi:hypothetical protein
MSTKSRRPDAAPTHAVLPASGDQLAGFFLPSPPFDHESRHWGLRHPWREPPADVVPADAGVMLVLARSEGVAVIVHQLEAWPGGFRLTLRVRTRPGGDVPVDDPVFTYEPYARRRVDHGKMPPPEQLLFGLQLPGGERLTNLSPGAPPGPFLTESRLPGVKGEWVYQYRLTPLPDPGLMWIVCEWPRLSIPISGIEVDAGVIRAVAERAIRLW